MPKIGTLDFTGISGHKYTFNVYPMKREKKDKEAVYFVTRRLVKADGAVEHLLLFVGQCGDLSQEFANHPKNDELMHERANCICVYWEDHPDTRAKIAQDLIDFYHPPVNDFI